MSNLLEYKGYYGSIQCDVESKVIFGKLEWINDLITFEADSMAEIVHSFEESVDDYIEFCSLKGKEPEKAFKGSFNVRISSENHRRIAIAALHLGITLNQYVEQAIIEKLQLNHTEGHEMHTLMLGKLNTIENSVEILNQSVSVSNTLNYLWTAKGVAVSE